MKMEEIRALASLRSTPLRMADLYRYASTGNKQRLRNAQFLHKELPIRIAQRAVDLLTLPHSLRETVQIRIVSTYFLRFLKRLREFPLPSNMEEEMAFTDLLDEFLLDRSSIPVAVAGGMASLAAGMVKGGDRLCRQRQGETEDALYRFFTARVGLRFLTEHHVLGSKNLTKVRRDLRMRQSCLDDLPLDRDGADSDDEEKDEDTEEFSGCIQKNCDPVREAKRVADQVTKHCRECYGISPDVEVVDCTSTQNAVVEFTYVPHHLQYMLAELLKNSCRATVKR